MKVGIVGKGGVGKTTAGTALGVAALDPVRDEIERLIGFLEGSLVG